ncbi:MAG: twitching motility protein PilT [Lachnospiraceae bacterium]|nr:twitching motility protein PilT [Lachnospiraceae bacterium]
MISIISGKHGKGKTKYLLDQANLAVTEVQGDVVYLDKGTKHMYELNRKVRLIDVEEYTIKSTNAFVGFLCGIISQDHDLEKMYLDSFLKLAHLEGKDIAETIDELNAISEKFGVDMIISISLDQEEIPESAKKYITIAL